MTLTPQNEPAWNVVIGLKEKPVKMKAAHTNRNGMAAVVNKMNSFFI